MVYAEGICVMNENQFLLLIFVLLIILSWISGYIALKYEIKIKYYNE